MTGTLLAERAREQLEELHEELLWRQACSDFTWFCENVVQIERKDLTAGFGPFTLLEHQRDFADKLCTSRRVICLKGRQIGISTQVVAFFLWRAIRVRGFNGLILSHKDEYAKGTLARLRTMYNMLPAWLRRRLPEANEASGSFVLDWGDGTKSTVLSMPVTKKVGASMTLDLVFFDEAALAEYAEDAYSTLLPTLDAAAANPAWIGAVLILASTARGSAGFYARMWKRAKGLVKVFYPWWSNPYYTQDQYDRDLADARAKGEEHKHFQERPATPEEAFLKSGRSRFPHAPLPEECEDFPMVGRLEAGMFVLDPDGPLALFELPLPATSYVLAVDPASGKGLDYTVGTLLRSDEYGLPVLVGQWYSNTIEPFVYGDLLGDLGEFYADGRGKPALLAVENSGGHGDAAITVLRTRRYRNLYRYTPTTDLRKNKRTGYGFPTNKSSKPKLIDLLAHELGNIAHLPRRLAEELATFVIKDDGSLGADSSHDHDDQVMSLAIGLWVLTHATHADPTAPTGPLGEEAGDAGEQPAFRLQLGLEAEIAREDRLARQRSRNQPRFRLRRPTAR